MSIDTGEFEFKKGDKVKFKRFDKNSSYFNGKLENLTILRVNTDPFIKEYSVKEYDNSRSYYVEEDELELYKYSKNWRTVLQ